MDLITKIWLWGSLILPYFSFFFLRNKMRLLYFLPVGFLSIVLNGLVYQIFSAIDFLHYEKNLFFLTDIPSKTYGLLFIGAILSFYFTYDNFWKYCFVNLILSCLFTFVFPKFTALMELANRENYNPLIGLAVLTLTSLILYAYQKLQDKVMKGEYL